MNKTRWLLAIPLLISCKPERDESGGFVKHYVDGHEVWRYSSMSGMQIIHLPSCAGCNDQ